jgi:AraC-like DNA-binding protein
MHEVECARSESESGERGAPARVSTILTRALIEAVESAGTPVADFLRRADVSAQQFDTPYGWVEVGALDRLIQYAVEVTGDAAFGLHWAERSPMLKFDVLATATAYAPSLRVALQCVLRFQSLLCERPELALIEGVEGVEGDDPVLLRFTPVATTELAARVRAEVGVFSLLRLMRHVGASECAVRRVAFAHRPPSYAEEYARLLGSRVRFGQPCSGIEIDPAWLDRSVHHANLELHQLLTRKAQEVLTRVQVRAGYAEPLRAYLRRVSPRLPEMREAARALAVSERSLRRRLGEEGWSYSAILDERRQLLAQQLLVGTARSVKQIAAEVGFTSTAAFFRAFKRWTGESPSAYRSARLTHGPSLLSAAGTAVNA